MRCGEKCLDPVIVFLPNGTELMVMAAGAADGDPKQPRADHIRHLHQNFIPVVSRILITGVFAQRPETMEPGSHQHLVILGVYLVARELFADKLVVRLSFADRPDDVIAITPRLGTVSIVLDSVPYREADHDQPSLS